MGDIKLCSSCGNSIPAEAVFCPNCGQKQEILTQEPEKAVQTPEETVVAGTEETAQEVVFDNPSSEAENQQVEQAADLTKPESTEQDVSSTPATTASQQQPVSPSPAAEVPQQQPPVSPKPETQQQPYGSTPAYAQPQQPYYQQQQSYQQPAAPQKPKKKFPWVFTVVWIGMLIFVGVWVFLWTTYPDSQKPAINVDTLRILAPVVSGVLLIYTLNLKLIVKKLKVIPTILLIISLLFSVFMFFSFELIEGDMPHDLIRPITEIFFEFN